MKLTIKTSKPRNPYAVAALRRKAGAHRPSRGALRQRDRFALRQALQHGNDPNHP